MLLIPHHALTPEALHGLIEEFVTRDGTDYGESEIALKTKVDQVRRQLDQGVVVILFQEEDGSVAIVRREDLPLRSRRYPSQISRTA